jgi:hypothetical protein
VSYMESKYKHIIRGHSEDFISLEVIA